ncbi:MAG: hypothetical protein DYG98_14345 [Haliscomenobacteraceae bacterium CHB4]|nr:hypothetical protein [Saprospiraceae bacterium]MCE7924222.1 hypothetical protein [Haliscomenobacteraceae bacterium CHB4]
MNAFRIILYQQRDNRWHYVRLTAESDRELRTETGICGLLPDHTETALLPDGTNVETALREAGADWQNKGWRKPAPHEVLVLTLHFQMRRWHGYPASAPWHDDLTSGYLDPIQAALESTCNGIRRGADRFSGNYLYHYTIFNSDLALEAVERLAAAAPVKFLLDVHIGRREKQVHIPIDPNVPEYLRSLFRVVEKSAHTIASELPVLFPGDPLQPEPVLNGSAPKRIRGEAAAQLRHVLKEKWNFDSNFWNPLTEASPSQVVFLNGIPDGKTDSIVQLIHQRLVAPLYLLDCEEGLFEISSDEIFKGVYEGVVFDAGLEWIIYFSHHHTVSFGGEWLVSAVKELFKEQPEVLNAW